MNTQQLKQFWDRYPKKTWVVTLSGVKRSKHMSDIKYVTAKTEQGALKTAKFYSLTFSKKPCTGTARLAHPVNDLHCVPAR